MKKNFGFLLSVAFLLTMLLSSCSKMPKYSKLIPDDAYVLVRFDVKQILEKSELADNSDAKKEMRKALKESNLRKETREKIEEIISNPLNLGLDLRDPVVFYVTPQGHRMNSVLVGSVYDDDDFASFLNTMAKEADVEKVKTKNDLSYIYFGRTAVYFDDESFYIAEVPFGADEDDCRRDVQDLFQNKDEKGTMAAAQKMTELCSRNGIVQLMITGDALEEMARKESELRDLDLDLSKIDLLADLEMNDGECSITGEVLTDDAQWKEELDNMAACAQKIDGSLFKYLPQSGLNMLCGIDGEKIWDALEEDGLFKQMKGEDRRMFRKMLCSAKGNMAWSLYDIDTTHGSNPVMVGYMQTTDNSIVKAFQESNRSETVAGGLYREVFSHSYDYDYETGDMNSVVSSWMVYGCKNNVSGFAVGYDPKPFTPMTKAFTGRDAEGKLFYACCDANFISRMAGKMNGNKEMKEYVQKQLKQYDYTEMYLDKPGKLVWKLYLTDKKANPLALLTQSCVDLVKELRDGMFRNDSYDSYDDYSYDDLAELDTLAVDTVAWDDEVYVEEAY